jgi:hypothetical protein
LVPGIRIDGSQHASRGTRRLRSSQSILVVKNGVTSELNILQCDNCLTTHP